MPYMDQLGISSNIEFPTERADYAPTAISTSYYHYRMSVFLWPLLQTALYPVTHPVPFHNGSVSRDPVPLRQVVRMSPLL